MSDVEKLWLTSQSTPSPSPADQSDLDLEEDFSRAFSLSRSNLIPNSAVERSQLRTLIEETRRNLQKFELQDAQRVQLAKILELQESLLSPIRTLPPEIMSEIFEFVIFELDTPERNTVEPGVIRACVRGSIYPLTWVSSWWREIIVSQPSFWSCLLVELAEPVLDIIPILGMCLARSGAAPLRLGLLPGKIELTPGLCSVLDDLARHADRWKEFVFWGDLPSLDYILKQARNFTEFSILDALAIFVNDISANSPGILGDSFIHSPRLRNLRISHLCATDTIELTHLSTLRITLYRGSAFAVLLEKCPTLETLTVHRISKAFGDEATSILIPCVRHTQLRTLELIINKDLVVDAWQSVQLPNLINIQIRGINKGSFCDVAKQRFDELKVMLSYSQCVLDRVQLLGDIDLDSDIVASLFRGIRVRSESNSRFVGDHPYNPTTTKSGSS
ncbi:hypothetical protein BT96DRAFT_928755 [Gymnopus androsaceus JB14]|uniref:F-box domain-containing protein n=1 Tax=Gymnopus androsaceus JB14 TaxID=1447944 RepID=A0A6A4GJF3_9AGAR|nr:hypothetical protein BT96DRAFT_928755 [Gymnopus androsaceus JB14]